MKRVTLFILAILIHISFAKSQEVMVAGWTFPSNSLAADTGFSANLEQEIITVGGTSSIELKNGFTTKAAQASGWDEGMDVKGWVVALSTEGIGSLTVSSRQQSGGTDPGPKYFQLQYSIDGGASWNDLENGEIDVENDWETSFVDHLPLPGTCDNLEQLMLRWLMASNEASGGGGTVTEVGKSKIDEIFIRGEEVNAVSELHPVELTLAPGPRQGSMRVRSNDYIEQVIVRSLSGSVLKNITVHSLSAEIGLDSFNSPQIVIVTVVFRDGITPRNCKYLLF